MRDSQLAELAEEAASLKTEIDDLTARRTRVTQRIIKEMERRGTEGIITNGYKITYVQQKPVVISEARLKRALDKRDPKLWSRCMKSVFDPNLVSALVQEGRVPVSVVARCSSVEPKAPYVLVTPEKDS